MMYCIFTSEFKYWFLKILVDLTDHSLCPPISNEDTTASGADSVLHSETEIEVKPPESCSVQGLQVRYLKFHFQFSSFIPILLQFYFITVIFFLYSPLSILVKLYTSLQLRGKFAIVNVVFYLHLIISSSFTIQL